MFGCSILDERMKSAAHSERFGLCRNFLAYIEGHAIFATVMEPLLQMPTIPRLYLDHAATTPMGAAAQAAMVAGMQAWANPSSPHQEGRAARAALEGARSRIATALGWSGDVILTSGASEALSIGLLHCKADAIWISAVEHDAVHRAATTARIIPVNTDGIVAPDFLEKLLKDAGTACPLVCVQSANSETGVIQPLAEIGAVVKRAGGLLLADCSQSAGKLPLPDADLIAVSAHKLGGPPGIAALLVRDLGTLNPTGGQEKGYRGGTENLPAAMAMAAALEAGFGWMEQAGQLRTMLDAEILGAGGTIVAGKGRRIATIASYAMPGVAASSQLIGFDMAGIAVSAGSACSSGTLKSSAVLAAMGWDGESAGQVIRVSFGPDTNAADIARFMMVWRQIKTRADAA
jgi:cysteine desulfurase